MSKIEDFENAPVGATASLNGSARVWKSRAGETSWATAFHYQWLSSEELAERGYALEHPAPTTAREAIDLTWELAHEVKEGQVIPEGAWLVDRRDNKITVEKNTFFSIDVDEWGAENIRTLEPLRETEPDWLDAPAVIATCGCRGVELWYPHESKDGLWVSSVCGEHALWSTLRDVTPLHPKEDA